MLSCRVLQTERLDSIRRRSDKGDAFLLKPSRKLGVLGQKSVARDDGIDGIILSYTDDLVT